MSHRVVKHLIALTILGCVTFAVYSPGLNGPFLFDDTGNFLQVPGVAMSELSWGSVVDAALSKTGVEYIHRPIPRVTFALNYYFAGERFSNLVFKTTNLVIHLLNGGLVFWLSLLLVASLRAKARSGGSEGQNENVWFWFPVVVAAAWTLHPLQLTSVLYAVQRMTSLAGTGVLLGLVIFTIGRIRVTGGKRLGFRLMLMGVGGGTLLGVMSKENAVLMPVFACLVELFFFSRHALESRSRFRLKVFYIVLVGAMVLGAIVVLLAIPDLLLRLYGARTFSPGDRLLTQPRVLVYYLGLLFFPNLRSFSLFHDDLSVSTGLLDPATTLTSILFLGVLVSGAVITLKRRSVFAFATLWYLAGHGVESTILGLELVHEHRNYLPSFGVLFGLVFYVFRLAERREDLRRLITIAGVGAMIVLSFVTHTRASVWATTDQLIQFTARNHPNSYRALMEKGLGMEKRGALVKDTYAIYLKAARVNPHVGNPVARMQRIVGGLIYNLSEGNLVAETEETPAMPERWDVPLLIDLPYLRKLDELGSAEFTHRLLNTPMNAEFMNALRELQQCVSANVDSCVPTHRLDKWMAMALEIRSIRPIQRAGLLLTHARVLAYMGDVQQAVEMVEEAFVLTGREEVGFLIELAQLFRVIRDYDNAEKILGRIAVLVGTSGRRTADYKRLKKYVALERAEFEEANKTNSE